MIYSADHSRQMNEAHYASGGTHQAFIAIEWNQTWGKKADEEFANLYFPIGTPERSKWDVITSNMRVQLIKQPGTRQGLDGKISVFVAYPTEQNPTLYAFHVDDYAELLDLNFKEGTLIESPLYLVCTHSQRDVCCARDGLPLYRALQDEAGDAVWQSSHIGGHRFAATMLCLPSGLYYGRIEQEDAAEIHQQTQQGKMINRLYRGRACYTAYEQAAEYFLRVSTGITALDHFTLIESEPYRCVFQGKQNRHIITLNHVMSSWKVIVNSGETEGKSQPIFTLISHKSL